MAEHIPFPRRTRRLPEFLTPEEVRQVFNAVQNPKHLMMLETIYATGVRCGELVKLKVEDIDSTRKVVIVRNGKGGKERLTLLDHVLLEKLRSYFRQYQPNEWLFEGRQGHASTSVPQKACQRAERDSGIGKRVTPHVLRHYAELGISATVLPLHCSNKMSTSPPSVTCLVTAESKLLNSIHM